MIVIRDPQNTLTASIGTVVDTHEIRVARAAITGNGLHVELNGGAAARFGLKAGDMVRHPIFQPIFK